MKGRSVATTDGWWPQGGEGDMTATESARVETTGVEVTLVNLALSCCFFFLLAEEERKVTQGQSSHQRKFEYVAWEAAEEDALLGL